MMADQPTSFADQAGALAGERRNLGQQTDAIREAMTLLAVRWIEDGGQKQQIAEALDISRPTLDAWIDKYNDTNRPERTDA